MTGVGHRYLTLSNPLYRTKSRLSGYPFWRVRRLRLHGLRLRHSLLTLSEIGMVSVSVLYLSASLLIPRILHRLCSLSGSPAWSQGITCGGHSRSKIQRTWRRMYQSEPPYPSGTEWFTDDHILRQFATQREETLYFDSW